MAEIDLLSAADARSLTDRIKASFAEVERLRELRSCLPKGEGARPVDLRAAYFIEAGNGLIKIGVSANPRERLKTLQTMSPVPLRLLATIPGAGAGGEAQLHERFAMHRAHGEWFVPAPDLLNYIEGLK